jgi:hypothetical protein
MKGYDTARQVLSNAKIGINDVVNILPLDYYYHRRIHTNNYRDWVNDTLQQAEDRGDSIACTLMDMGDAIINGTAPF